jgi:exopolysaccharide biosynthesis polyprenyl glycosylphosphotransferase
MAAVLAAYFTYETFAFGKKLHYSVSVVSGTAFIFALFFVYMLDREGVYSRASSLLRIRETERILRVSMTAFGFVFPVAFFIGHLFSRWAGLFAMVLVPLVLALEKQFMFQLVRQFHSRGYGVQKVLVYGAGLTGRHVFSALVRSPKLGLNPVAIVDDDEALAGQQIYGSAYRRAHSAPVITGPLTAEMLREYKASLVIVGIPSLPTNRLQELSAEAFAARATLAFVPQLSYTPEGLTEYADIDGVLIASLAPATRRLCYETSKRIFDFVAASVLLVPTALVWAVVAVLIRSDSPGPVLFHQMRVGLDGAEFKLYKFRTMSMMASKYDFHPQTDDDPRITRVGRWLRRTSLDELPQLLNVLKGEMSLVGPRPEMPFIVKQYNLRHRQRLAVKPGITGLWQLSADRAFLIHENIQYDLYYIHHRNFFMDLAVLLHTVVFAMNGV